MRVNDQFQLVEWQQGDFLISTDAEKLDVDVIHNFLAYDSYWSVGVSKENVMRRLTHSLCFGVYHCQALSRQQVGFARVITDFTVFAYIADVFIVPAYQGQGLGKWLMRCLLAHPELQTLRRWSLNTRTAQGLYAQYGFINDPHPENYMRFYPQEGRAGQEPADHNNPRRTISRASGTSKSAAT